MGLATDNPSMGTTFVVGEVMNTVTDEICAITAEACQAVAAAVWLGGATDGICVGPRTAIHDDPDLVGRLERFLDKRCRGTELTGLSGLEPHVSESSENAIFLLLPLQASDQVLGAIAIAIPMERWADTQIFDTCAKVAELAAMVLLSSSSRYQLEVDLADMRQRTQRLARTAEVDDLTQVENKASFEAKVRQRLSQRSRPAALLALDMDHFKQINDVYGHQFGDQFLKTIAETLKASLPKSAIIGRTGGDEFCVLVDIPAAGRSYLHSLIRQVRHAVQRSVAVLAKPDLGRMSIGVSLFPVQASAYDQLMSQADLALYAAKRTERNTTEIFDSSLNGMMEQMGSRSAPVSMERDRITAHFQPIVNFTTGACEGLELLARWQEDGATTSGPKKFAWMFRDHRLASKLTVHIVERALQQLMRSDWIDGGDLPDLWINVTDHDLLTPEFVFDLQTALATYGVGWEKIVIEVHEESMLGERNGQVFHSLQEIRRRGGRIALDDFGTGHAGLTHVRHWPVDIIKIDRSFVEHVASDKGSHVVVEALLMVANAMSQHVVAEGIETQSQLVAMRALGCSFAQGFFLSEPLSSEELSACPKVFDLDQLTRISA